MASGPEHYREAERLLVLAHRFTYGDGADPATGAALAAEAQAHATLALAAPSVNKPAEEPAATGLTVYRAEHESIVMGRYTTREAARVHCETLMRREVGEDAFLGWVPDHGGEDAPEELCIGEDVECTGYVVTPLEVASEYDEEADE